MSRHVRLLVTLVIVAASAGALVRAATLTAKYQAEVQRLRSEWRTEQQTLGLAGSTNQKKLYAAYPTPEVRLCTPIAVQPGASATITLPGSFAPKTAFLMEHDQVTLSGGAITPKGYTATIAVAPDAAPGFARLYAYAPVSGAYTRCPVAVIAPLSTYTLSASNGWTIKLTPEAKAYTISASEATLGYKAEYFKPGEARPFETMTGTATFESSDLPEGRVSLQMLGGGLGTAMAEFAALQKEMSDPAALMKKSPKEQEAFYKKLEAISERMSKEQEAAAADPAALQKKQDDFGCQTISLIVTGAGTTGNVGCGKNVGQLRLTAVRTP